MKYISSIFNNNARVIALGITVGVGFVMQVELFGLPPMMALAGSVGMIGGYCLRGLLDAAQEAEGNGVGGSSEEKPLAAPPLTPK